MPGRAEQQRGRQLLHRRQQHEPGAGDEARQHERQLDRPEPAPPVGAERCAAASSRRRGTDPTATCDARIAWAPKCTT